MLPFRRYFASLFLSSILPLSSPALAGGFYLQEQSPLEIGRAFSGEAAAADDPSTIFFNPAGMTELDGIQITTGGTALFINSHQSNRGSTLTIPGLVGGPHLGNATTAIPGSNGGNPFDDVVPLPSFYASAHVSDSPLWLGLGVSAPFGLKLDYASDFFGRYDSLHSKLTTYDIQPSAALRLSDRFSIGGGIDIQYADVNLTNALPNPYYPPVDGFYQVHGNDWSMGWNFGVLAKFGRIRLGLHYRSRIKHDLEGRQTISLVKLVSGSGSPFSPFLVAATPVTLTQTDTVTAPLTLPDIVTASAAFNVDTHTRLMATGRFYNWSVFKRIEIVPESGSPAIKQLNYKDSWSIAVGGERDLSDKLTLRAGAMFDKTPTNKDFLTTRVPDGDRTWLTAGATYNLSRHLAINASYAHVFVKSALMDRTDSFYGGGVNIRTLTRSSGNVDMLATSLTARF